jgi:CubicO group peptidase (beta-lactamase class C family)
VIDVEENSIPIASATKWLTGAIVLTLVDEGKLGLDHIVSRYLPEFTGDKARITVRQLLSHMSGLPMTGRALDRRDITLKQAVDVIAAAPLMSPPGEICVYGDASVQVAGRIAEIEPLNLKQTIITSLLASASR